MALQGVCIWLKTVLLRLGILLLVTIIQVPAYCKVQVVMVFIGLGLHLGLTVQVYTFIIVMWVLRIIVLGHTAFPYVAFTSDSL